MDIDVRIEKSIVLTLNEEEAMDLKTILDNHFGVFSEDEQSFLDDILFQVNDFVRGFLDGAPALEPVYVKREDDPNGIPDVEYVRHDVCHHNGCTNLRRPGNAFCLEHRVFLNARIK